MHLDVGPDGLSLLLSNFFPLPLQASLQRQASLGSRQQILVAQDGASLAGARWGMPLNMVSRVQSFAPQVPASMLSCIDTVRAQCLILVKVRYISSISMLHEKLL